MNKGKLSLEARQVGRLLSLVEFRLRYLERSKWKTTNDEARVFEMSELNRIWEVLVFLQSEEDKKE